MIPKEELKLKHDLIEFQHDMHGMYGYWNNNGYSHGFYNGIELMLALINGRTPELKETKEYIEDLLSLAEKRAIEMEACALQLEIQRIVNVDIRQNKPSSWSDFQELID